MQERIKGKGKGKEMLYRFEGEVVGADGEGQEEAAREGSVKESEVVVRDPRKERTFKRPQTLRPGRDVFYEVTYEVSFQCGDHLKGLFVQWFTSAGIRRLRFFI